MSFPEVYDDLVARIESMSRNAVTLRTRESGGSSWRRVLFVRKLDTPKWDRFECAIRAATERAKELPSDPSQHAIEFFSYTMSSGGYPVIVQRYDGKQITLDNDRDANVMVDDMVGRGVCGKHVEVAIHQLDARRSSDNPKPIGQHAFQR